MVMTLLISSKMDLIIMLRSFTHIVQQASVIEPGPK